MLLSKETYLSDKFYLSMEIHKSKGQWLEDLLKETKMSATELSQITGVDTPVAQWTECRPPEPIHKVELC